MQRVDRHDALPSTNSHALDLAARSGTPVPALVLADRQTAGRGRGSNVWWSDTGALTFSLILDPPSGIDRVESWPRTALAAAVATCEALEMHAPDARFEIRWPNDVCHGERKICGILPEVCMGPVPRIVLGIGVNVNNTVLTAPDPLPRIATALCDITGRPAEYRALLMDLLQRLAVRIDDLATGNAGLAEAWCSRCMLKGRTVRLDGNGAGVEGACAGIDRDGALGIKTPGGVRRFFGGTIAQYAGMPAGNDAI